MIYGFYFRFYKMFHSRWLSCFLSRIAYFLYVCLFQVKRLFLKKQVVSMEREAALDIVTNAHPDPKGRPTYTNPPMDPTIDLSVIMPVYNYADLIEDCIESILNQKTTYTFELILVDDGSTDGARQILERYMDRPHVKVIFQQNKGIGGARNTGIDHAVGRYLMFIDCDDTVHDDIVQVLMEKACKEDRDIVMCAHNLSKEANGEVYQVIPNIYPDKNLMNFKNGDDIMNFAGLPWAKVYKRDLFEKVRFFPGYWYEDTIIMMLLFTQSQSFAYIPKVEYEYKWYEKNFSHVQTNATNVRTTERYWLLKAIVERYEEMGMPLDAAFYTLVLRHVSAYYYPTITGLDEQLVNAMFTLAHDLVVRYRPNTAYKLPYMLRVTEKAILEKNIALWKLASTYQ